MAIRRPDEAAAIWTEHRKTVERVAEGDPFETRAVDVDLVDVKIAAARVVKIRREDYSFSIREEVRAEIGFPVAGHLALV